MKTIRRVLAIGMVGVVAGGVLNVMTASPATARIYRCDAKIDAMEQQAAKAYAKGKLTAKEFANVQAEIAFHRELWGC